MNPPLCSGHQSYCCTKITTPRAIPKCHVPLLKDGIVCFKTILFLLLPMHALKTMAAQRAACQRPIGRLAGVTCTLRGSGGGAVPPLLFFCSIEPALLQWHSRECLVTVGCSTRTCLSEKKYIQGSMV